MTEKFISWNVNGLRACMGKGFKNFFDETDADIFALQETKLQEGQIDFAPEGYMGFWNYAEKKGYSGTAVFTKKEPLSVAYGMDADEKFETEGRVITLEFPDYMNVAHNEIDLKNPKSNRGNAGFTDEERQKFTVLLESGFADSFRMLYPDRADAYTWWSYMFKARERNTGWRIDYFLVSARLVPSVKDAFIRPDVMGSDHCPVGLLLETQRQG